MSVKVWINAVIRLSNCRVFEAIKQNLIFFRIVVNVVNEEVIDLIKSKGLIKVFFLCDSFVSKVVLFLL